MSKNKTNPNKITCSLKDIQRYQKQIDDEWKRKHDEVYINAARWASVWYQSIAYKVLCEEFSFTADDLNHFQECVGIIAGRISATEGEWADYELRTVREELKAYDVEIDTSDLEQLGY